MKVLLVTYLGRDARSKTKILADHALGILKAKKAEVELLDLIGDIPDLLTSERLSVYYRRNYGGEKVGAAESALMAKMDRMTAQLKKADLVVVATPMYNFSQPAIVKAWFDSVMQKGETWDIGKEGYIGLMKGKKALLIGSSGGQYEGNLAFLEHLATLTKVHFGFMGYEAEAVVAAGINSNPGKEEVILSEARKKIGAVLEQWVQ